MVGLILSQLLLFVIAALAGFAIGWRFCAHNVTQRREALERDVAAFRASLSEAQVRRARGP